MTLQSWIRIMGIRQKEMAESLNLSPSYLSEIITGKKKVTPDIARRIEEYSHGEVSRLEVLYPNDGTQLTGLIARSSDLFAVRGSPLTTELRLKVLESVS
jgi:DNA-binding transcriptional regulator YdaS (Cro superfamily)